MDFSETKQEIFQADRSTRLLTRIWLPEGETKAVFLAIHGGLAHAGDWIGPALYFKERGVATYALDLRHHGTFPSYNQNGKNYFHIESYEQYSKDIDGFYLFIRERHPDLTIFIIAHSNGALIALNYLLSQGKGRDFAGVIISSPWLKNRVKVNPILKLLAPLIAYFSPLFLKESDIKAEELTHDKEIVRRHHKDEELGLRGTHGTARIFVEALRCQKRVLKRLSRWDSLPLFAVIAGEDRLADPVAAVDGLKKIPEELRTIYFYKDNYHENFNELNREEIFGLINSWMADKR